MGRPSSWMGASSSPCIILRQRSTRSSCARRWRTTSSRRPRRRWPRPTGWPQRASWAHQCTSGTRMTSRRHSSSRCSNSERLGGLAELGADLAKLLGGEDVEHGEQRLEVVIHAGGGQLLLDTAQTRDLLWADVATTDQHRCQELIGAEELKEQGQLTQLEVHVHSGEHLLDTTEGFELLRGKERALDQDVAKRRLGRGGGAYHRQAGRLGHWRRLPMRDRVVVCIFVFWPSWRIGLYIVGGPVDGAWGAAIAGASDSSESHLWDDAGLAVGVILGRHPGVGDR